MRRVNIGNEILRIWTGALSVSRRTDFGLSKESVKDTTAKNSCLGNRKSTTHTRYSIARSTAESREGESIFEGALDLGEERRCLPSEFSR